MGAVGCRKKDRALGGDRLEAVESDLQGGEILRGARIVIIEMEKGLDVVALGGNDGIIGVVDDKAGAERADSTAGGREFGSAEAEVVIEIADAITHADFAEAVKAVAEIHSGIHQTLAIIGEGIMFVVDQKGCCRGG